MYPYNHVSFKIMHLFYVCVCVCAHEHMFVKELVEVKGIPLEPMGTRVRGGSESPG